MPSAIPNNLKKITCLLYERILYRWEKELKNRSGFDIRAKGFKSEILRRQLYRATFAKSEDLSKAFNEKLHGEEYLYFVANGESQAKALYRHLRNAVAHAEVLIDGEYIGLKDVNRNKQITMLARLKLANFAKFITAIAFTVK